MHSFHHSRGRIFFEVLCALGISASFVGAWTQTGASALLPAAAVALLYGLVHMFDMFRRRPAAPKPEAVEVAAEQPVAAVQPVLADSVPEVTELAEPASLPARKARQPKASRKKAKAAEVARAEEGRTVEIVPDEMPEPVELLAEDPTAEEPMPVAEEHHASVTPLFEPVPFVRQPRTGFGRKAGLAFRR